MMGQVTEEQLYDAYAEQVAALSRGGADAILVETMIAVDEARQAIRAAVENTQCEILCTFTFDLTGKNEYRTMMGNSPVEVAGELLEAGADVVGTNCGKGGIDNLIPIVIDMREAYQDVPVMAHANAGIPYTSGGEEIYPDNPSDMAARLPSLLDAGAQIVGGCCGTTPKHIHAMREELDALL